MCEENWVDVTNERLENTFLIPASLSRPSQQTIEYRLLRPTPPWREKVHLPRSTEFEIYVESRRNTDVSNRPRLNK
ncbi:hypothetical protein CDAR_586861 [Caerostris darwini]|uniref:Uncharacterized protein n=1 Tax=Caerostris darwini TaxID=1538125 RepID=A0AAV4SZ58_9ARAC|nr:hypothetical protein CDAR_586861 [Caerostris darwini]